MNRTDYSAYTFLIVDDVRICRLNVSSFLKEMGCQQILYASSGKEALTILKNKKQTVDFVFLDFRMPEMNGLQVLKAIREGINTVRRDLPVVMLTGIQDENLLSAALELDVSAFLKKPPVKKNVIRRVKFLLTEQENSEDWLKEPLYYQAVDIDTPIGQNTGGNKPSAQLPTKPAAHESQGDEEEYDLSSVPNKAILSRDLVTKNGKLLFKKGTPVTQNHIKKLQNLNTLGFWEGTVWVFVGQSSHSAANVQIVKPARQGSTTDTSTFSMYGKINLNTLVACSRCENPFFPEPETLRLHNKRGLSELLCTNCSTRNSELLCASVRLMVLRGGFPMDKEQMVKAFLSRDPKLTSTNPDPFEPLRKQYRHDPLTAWDIQNWIRDLYFTLKPEEGTLECIVDRIMSNPEHVRLLGKEGIQAKQMASKKMLKSLHAK